MSIIACPTCSAQFKPKNARNKYCSKPCANKGKAQALGLTCAICHEPMSKSHGSRPQGEATHPKCRTKEPCSVDGCDDRSHARGMCPTHWARDRRIRLDLGVPPTPCALCGLPLIQKGEGMPLHRDCKDKVPLWQREGRTKYLTPQREARILSMVQGPKNEPRPKDMRSDVRAGYEDGDYARLMRGLRENTLVVDDGCWEWQGRTSGGYPECSGRKGRRLAVHRIVIEAREGKPLGVLAAHHKCANSACVNPDHLQAVTERENVAEMLARTSLEKRIAELEKALFEANPSHEVLNRIGSTVR